MALNVKSSIEVNTQTAEASLNRVVARFGRSGMTQPVEFQTEF